MRDEKLRGDALWKQESPVVNLFLPTLGCCDDQRGHRRAGTWKETQAAAWGSRLEERKWRSGYPDQLIKVALLDSIISLAIAIASSSYPCRLFFKRLLGSTAEREKNGRGNSIHSLCAPSNCLCARNHLVRLLRTHRDSDALIPGEGAGEISINQSPTDVWWTYKFWNADLSHIMTTLTDVCSRHQIVMETYIWDFFIMFPSPSTSCQHTHTHSQMYLSFEGQYAINWKPQWC